MAKQIREFREELFAASELNFDHRWEKWAKRVERVDTSAKDGYAFVGPFMDDGTIEIEIEPAVYLVGSETGSTKHRHMDYVVVTIDGEGHFHKTDIHTDNTEKGWALRIRDSVAALLETKTEQVDEPRWFAQDSDFLLRYPAGDEYLFSKQTVKELMDLPPRVLTDLIRLVVIVSEADDEKA